MNIWERATGSVCRKRVLSITDDTPLLFPGRGASIRQVRFPRPTEKTRHSRQRTPSTPGWLSESLCYITIPSLPCCSALKSCTHFFLPLSKQTVKLQIWGAQAYQLFNRSRDSTIPETEKQATLTNVRLGPTDETEQEVLGRSYDVHSIHCDFSSGLFRF